MKKQVKRILSVAAALLVITALFAGFTCFAEGESPADTTDTAVAITAEGTVEDTAADETGSSTSAKAIAAAICLAVAAAFGAIAMGLAISKSTDGISRQPEAEGKIRTTLMLGLVFIETLVIYALVLAILIIFVL